MNTQATSKTWIWIAGLIVVFVGVYYYINSTTPPASTQTLTVTSAAGTADSDKVLTLLNQVEKVNIDSKIFTDPAFLSLQDYTVFIPPVSVYRQNPFAPIPGLILQTTNTQNSQ